ncbi:serine hydrolase domain-containing protein [Vibrio sp. 99-70-13A1]|uniref:serine hydrolase domain-containing protein n=1 Tax=Vibrio sp. 99-70-13A1 TaxID=2607601 RepID=UPI0020A48E7E|nr:serine hydrolase domain-containing protein [Vibrio sp. 99-70-13A1]
MEPGYQYVIGNEDKLLVSSSSGLADVNSEEQLTPQHLMATFSMTKTVTAIAILQLLERGHLELEDSINTLLDTPFPDEITIRQLITHTSGIANPIPLKWVYLPEMKASFDEDNELNALMMTNKKIKSPPGFKYRYSNIGYWLAGKVIEKVSGKSYQTYIEENVFNPLNLKSDQVSFAINESKLAKGHLKSFSLMGMIAPFMLDRNLLTNRDMSWTEIKAVHVYGPSYGGVFSTAEGMFSILQDILKEQSVLLSGSTKTLLFTKQRDSNGRDIKMTLGWHTSTSHRRQYFYKEGGGAGYRSEMRIYPNERLASVIIANRTSYDVAGKLNLLDNLILAEQRSNY